MKILLFTSNAYRHKYLANSLQSAGHEVLAIVESKGAEYLKVGETPLISEHFGLRFLTEEKMFDGHAALRTLSFPVLHKEANDEYVVKLGSDFAPDIIFCFGASLLKDEILALRLKTKTGYFINLHLGLSPYYRGSGTNFWPFVNDELQYVGGTIHHIDSGIDTGNIIAQVRPDFSPEDNVHIAGCKVIIKSVEKIVKLLEEVEAGKELIGVPQWSAEVSRVYRTRDFTDEVLQKYYANLKGGMVERYINDKNQVKPKLLD